MGDTVELKYNILLIIIIFQIMAEEVRFKGDFFIEKRLFIDTLFRGSITSTSYYPGCKSIYKIPTSKVTACSTSFFHFQYLSLDIIYTHAIYDAIMISKFYFHLQYPVKSVVLEYLQNKLSNLNLKFLSSPSCITVFITSNSLLLRIRARIHFSFYASPHSSQIKTPTCYVKRPAYATRVLLTLYVYVDLHLDCESRIDSF